MHIINKNRLLLLKIMLLLSLSQIFQVVYGTFDLYIYIYMHTYIQTYLFITTNFEWKPCSWILVAELCLTCRRHMRCHMTLGMFIMYQDSKLNLEEMGSHADLWNKNELCVIFVDIDIQWFNISLHIDIFVNAVII